MALDDFSFNQSIEDRFQQYPTHPEDGRINKMIDELQEMFPEDVRVDFVEVSPRMTKTYAMAYWRERDGEYTQFMRIGEHYTEVSDTFLRRTVLHEMVHLYCFQMGYKDVSDHDDMFTWILGRLGASVSKINQDSQMWQDLAEPFLDD